jgi:hypothetical protein
MMYEEVLKLITVIAFCWVLSPLPLKNKRDE